MMDKETKAAERAKADKADKSDVKDRDKDHAHSKSPKKRRKVNHGTQKLAQLSPFHHDPVVGNMTTED